MAFDPITTPTDYVTVSGKKTPGIAEVVGVGSPRQWDERRGIDTSGATLRFRGKKLARFSVKMKLATVEDFAAWASFAPTVRTVPRGSLDALVLVHPQINDAGIRAGVVDDVIEPVRDGDNGAWVAEIKFIEFRQPIPAGATAQGSTNTPTPNPRQARIERNNEQIAMRNARAAQYR